MVCAEKKRDELEQRIKTLQASTSTSSAETQAQQNQISRLERSNRDTLSLLAAKVEAHDRLAEELVGLHQKLTSARQEIAGLEERNRNSENGLQNAKYREQALQSEVDQLQRNSDWLDSELKTKNGEHTKFRKEKNSRIAELQRANEEAQQSIESSQRTEAALRKRLEEMAQKTDQAFSKIQQLQEDIARKDEDFRLELDSSRRLADLQQQSAETARRRVRDLEQLIEQTKDDAAEEISQVQSELETERQGREASERRIEELESSIQRLEAEISAAPQDGTTTPQSRSNGFNVLQTPRRAASPAIFSPGSARSRGGTTFTQLISDHNNLKAELDSEKRSHANLRSTFDELMAELQQKEPELQQTQEDRDHFEAQVNQLSALLETARQERDVARKDVRRLQAQTTINERKAKTLEQQSRDLSVQIRVLLVEIQIREQGSQLDAVQKEQLQRAARGEDDLQALEGMSDTAQFISRNLVAFKDVFELQQKNAELTKIVREIGERLEDQEAKAKEDVAAQEHAELETLRERVERYKDEMQSLVTQSQSYIRERDMFRRMLTHRGRIPADADMESMFGQSTNGAGGPPATPQPGKATSGPHQSPSAQDVADHVKLLKELQSHFDAYRQETASEYSAAKAQVERLTKEKNQLQSEVVRTSSQLSLAQERYQMLQSNFELLRTENGEIQKRSNTLHEAAAKQDIRTQQAAEDLVEAQSLAEGLRSENSNLKAEKDLWKRIETRLGEDNRTLLEEKGRLNKIITDTQNLANERELTDSETRRRLQSQVESLDADLRSTRTKLEEEIESNKSATLRREYEQEQNRTRIDDLMKSLSNVKEELIAAKTTRDQLQSRVEEMKIDLRAAEDRTQVLQPRPTPRTATTTVPENVESDLSREQQLAMEIVEIKRELELSKADLENVRQQVEQYRTISQSAEEELSSINESHDQYREDAEKIIAEKDSVINDLEQRLQDTAAELSSTSAQLNELRASASDHNTRLEQQRAIFDGELAQIKDECERYKETANFHQQDLKAQAEVAQQAQQSYENELVKHAEAAKSLKKVRDELNEIKLEISQAKADADAARMTLSQSEDSWDSTKDQYERELTELKTRRDDVDAQNKLLHAQLESVGAQITALQQQRSAPTDREDDHNVPATDLQNLQQVINYLRREKEIVDVQYELSVQESRRLKQQLEYAQTQLDESRLRLEQDRQRQAERENGTNSHTKLMETLNELNVFRESSVTLRSECRQAQSQLAVKTKEVEDLQAQIQPLQSSIRELEGDRETMQGEMKLLEEDRNASQQRIQNILQKYNRIDPAELEGLKEQIKTLESEREATIANTSSLQEQVDGFEERISKAQDEGRKDMREKLTVQFKARSKELSQQINAAKAENKSLSEQLEATKSEIQTLTAARDEAIAHAEAVALDQQIANSNARNGSEEGQVEEDGEVSGSQTELQGRVSAAETVAEQRLKELEASRTEAKTLQEEITKLQQQISGLEANLANVNSELTSLRSHDPAASGDEHIERLQADLTAAQSELEALRASAGTGQSQAADAIAEPSVNEDELAKRVEAIRAELDAAHAARMKELDENFDKRVHSMRDQLNEKLRDGRRSYQETINAERDAAIQELQQRLEQAQQAAQQPGGEQSGVNPASDTSKAAAGTENAFNEDSTVKLKVESSSPPDQWTMAQVQAFVASNEHVKGIVTKSIKNNLMKETARLKEQHEKELSEKIAEVRAEVGKTSSGDGDAEAKVQEVRTQAETELKEKLEEMRLKAEKAREQAVFMEGKKYGVKISIAEGKARNSTAKLEVVEKAANDTPQRPVAEVWAIAKDVKAPAPPATPQAPGPAAASAVARKPSQTSLPAPAGTAAPSATAQAGKTAAAKTDNAPAPQANGTTASTTAPAQSQTGGAAAGPGTGPAALRGIAAQGSGIPRGGISARGSASRGDASQGTQRGGGQSALPRGGTRGTATRGRGLPRGNQAGAPGRGGAMNAAAQQFVPGGNNKRAREESPGDAGNKKPRGGGQGA